jgi:ubiquinone/menaquinone biosynthesis C-methylase UbiE
MSFLDLFSNQAKAYAQFRPTYPVSLFQYLSSLTRNQKLAWDVGTGNGQAAISLAKIFSQVVATDPSQSQIENAIPMNNIRYLVGAEKQPELNSGSVDLITIAQAIHWFQFDSFYEEVRRVTAPNAVCAAWAYDFNLPIQENLDATLKHFYFETLGPYWASNNRLIWDGYKDIPFPFQRIEAPTFTMEAMLNLYELVGYLSSWSATTKYIEKNKINPLEPLLEDLRPNWGNPNESKCLQWNLHLLVGRV